MNVDWGAIVEETDDSVRGVLAALLGQADDIARIVLVIEDHEGMMFTWHSTDTIAQIIGLLAYAQFRELRGVETRSGD